MPMRSAPRSPLPASRGASRPSAIAGHQSRMQQEILLKTREPYLGFVAFASIELWIPFCPRCLASLPAATRLILVILIAWGRGLQAVVPYFPMLPSMGSIGRFVNLSFNILDQFTDKGSRRLVPSIDPDLIF